MDEHLHPDYDPLGYEVIEEVRVENERLVAEVERLKRYADDCASAARSADRRAQEAEAEVERLRAALERVKNTRPVGLISDWHGGSPYAIASEALANTNPADPERRNDHG